MNHKKYFLSLLVLALILIGQTAIITKLWRNNTSLANSINTQAQINSDDLSYNMQQEQLAVLPQENKLYLPELHIAVPLDDITRSLYYNYHQGLPGDGGTDIRVYSAFVGDQPKDAATSCSDMVRLKIESKPDAYAPDQPIYASVKLSNGQTMQVYALTTKGCEGAWTIVSPQEIAAEFKKATYYSSNSN